MDTTSRFSGRRLPLVLGLLLWGTSAVLTLSLFLSLSGGLWWKQVIAVVWAVGLEGTKIQAWRIGGPYRWLALGLVGLTLFSVWGLAVGTVEGEVETALVVQQEASQSFRDARRSVEDLQTQISILVRRLSTMPENFVTATNQLNQEILSLRERLEAEQRSLSAHTLGNRQDGRGTDPFSVLASAWGWSRRTVVILVLLIVAGLTEVSALAMVGYRPPIVAHGHQDKTQSIPVITEADYLKVALDHPNHPTRLLGRREVAKRLAINENQARALLARLIDKGQVVRVGKCFEACPTSGKDPLGRQTNA